MNKPLFVVYDDIYLNWQLGSGDGSHPTNPIRAKLATEKLQALLPNQVQVINPAPIETREADLEKLAEVHSEELIHAVIHNYVSNQWNGAKPEVAEAGFAMFRGTVRLVEAILKDEINIGFNPQGAKHHATRNTPSGFCVFNDLAWAALELKKHGLKPLYLDWDIHAGDGTQAMLADTDIPTISIHNRQIFPGGHDDSNPEQHYYNLTLTNGDGDAEFKQLLDQAEAIIQRYQPDVILLAAGADGHGGASNLGKSNNYTMDGFLYAADMVARQGTKVIIGGAGGYQPLDHTPEIWARVVERIYIGKGNKC